MPATKSSIETVTFPIDIQDRLLRIVEDHAVDISMKTTHYIPNVMNSYRDGKANIPRPEKPSLARLSLGRKGQKFKITRLNATYQEKTADWIEELGQRAGGFKRTATITLLLLDWFQINPFPDVFDLKPGALAKKNETISSTTSMTDRLRGALTCQKRLLRLLERAGDPMPLQQYMRAILASYARGEIRALRPPEGSVPALKPSRAGKDFPNQNLSVYFSPDLLQWIDELGIRAAGLNRSHVMLLLFLDWLHVSPFAEICTV